MKGKLIVIEGLDGAGKSTAIEAISEYLESEGQEYIVVQEPGTTPLGSYLRSYVKSVDTPPLDPKSEILLFFLSRSVLVNDVIKPQLAKGVTVIMDRFFRATVAYQGFGTMKDDISNLSLIRDLTDALGLEQLIDLELLLDITVAESRKRSGLRGTECQIETRNDEFFEAARYGYLQDAAHLDYITQLNGMTTPSLVTAQVLNRIKELKWP